MNEETSPEAQVAYKLAYEEVIRWRAELDAQLDRIRNRAMAFLAVAVIAAGTGLASFPTEPAAARPSVLWMFEIGAGVLVNLVAVLVVLGSPEGPFGDNPHALVARGDDVDMFPTDSMLYRDLALWGHENVLLLYVQVNARRYWLYVSIAGIALELAGLAALHWNRLFP